MIRPEELLTPDQKRRVETLNAAFIERPQLAFAVNRILNYFSLRRDGSDHGFLYLFGEKGAGKSTVIKRARAIIQRQCAEESALPAAYFLLPETCTRKDFMSKCLESIGDPAAHIGTRTSMSQRFHKAAKRANVLIMFVDELGHIVSSDNDKVNETIGDLFKLFCEEWRRPVVLAGRPHSGRVLQSNDQLRGRGDDVIELKLFSLDTREEIEECQLALRDFDDQLPFPDYCLMADPDQVVAHLEASDYCPRILVKLTRRAGYLAIQDAKHHDPRRIEMEHWQEAWANLVGSIFPGRKNPYAGLTLPRSPAKPVKAG